METAGQSRSPALDSRFRGGDVTRFFALFLILSSITFAQAPAAGAQQGPSEPIKEARKLVDAGKYDEAIPAFEKIAAADPKSWEAHLGIGTVLDLKGDYEQARKHIQEGIDIAPADSKAQGWRAMAMSYGFERDAKNVEKYGKQVFDYRQQKNDAESAAEAANELARVLLESGDIDGAEKWYRIGHETSLKKPKLSPQERDLWDFRWESAQARVAARRGNKAEAQKHAAAAKAILDKGTNPEQALYGPYVNGYVAFYAGDYKTAVDEFLKSNPRDPFNLVMIAQAYEKLGDTVKAKEYYEKALASNAHNPTNAYARPIARQKLAAKS
jgi:tetratricopeptide (TPR) repeat protein